MRVLACADLHGVSHVYEWLLAEARGQGVDAIVLAGDLLGCPEGFDAAEAAQRHDASIVARALEVASAPVLYVMGTDDLVELEPAGDRVQSIHGRRVSLGGFHFVGYEYSLPGGGGRFEKSDPAIGADLGSLAGLMDDRTVFVSHSPVFGTLDQSFGDTRIGSNSLRMFLDANPFLLHVHGHAHDGFGRSGKHVNVASGGHARAMILDLVTGSATVRTGGVVGSGG
jgi:Icc-related predicted phosphoesterase